MVNDYAPNLLSFTLLKNELVNYHQDQINIGRDFNCILAFTIDMIREEPPPTVISFSVTHLYWLDTWRVKHQQSRQYT